MTHVNACVSLRVMTLQITEEQYAARSRAHVRGSGLPPEPRLAWMDAMLMHVNDVTNIHTTPHTEAQAPAPVEQGSPIF